MKALFFKVGSFSLINDALWQALPSAMPDFDWECVDIESDIVNRSPLLRARAMSGAMIRYGSRIIGNRQPPRDFYVRLPLVLHAIRADAKSRANRGDVAMVFQTQSLFNAGVPGLPHFVYTDHTYLANRRYPIPKPLLPVPSQWLQMERDLYRMASMTFVSSEFARASVIEDYCIPPGAVTCVHSGSNVPYPDAVDFSKRSGRVVLFVGVDWERKGGPELMAAFREVRRQRNDAELWIVGCDPWIRDAGVRTLGRVSRAETAACYEKADVFCLPSRMDPSASVLAEAGSYALPIVATPVGGNVERVESGVTGFLCAPQDLASYLIRLLDDSELRRRMGVAARTRVEAQFTWAAVSRKMAAKIHEMLP